MAVNKLEIASREPYLGGKSFGEYGTFEYLSGTMHFAVDPKHSANNAVVDIDLVPTGPDGKVQFSSDFCLLKPVQAPPGGRLVYDVVNRGGKTITSTYGWGSRAPLADGQPDTGDGFLQRHGFTQVWCG